MAFKRPLRASQLHHACCMVWPQLPVLHGLCGRTSLVAEANLRRHLCIQRRRLHFRVYMRVLAIYAVA